MQEPYYVDVETIGLDGIIVLIQYAKGDDGEIHLLSPWEVPIGETITVIEEFANNPGGIVGFNLVFDWFHLYKMWTIWKMLAEIVGDDIAPEEAIAERGMDFIIELEASARDYPLCLKPQQCLDLFLQARKGPYQSLMDRKDIRIKKIPSAIAWMIAEELEKRVPLKQIYFARRKKDDGKHWQIQDRHDAFGDIDPNFKDIVLRFKPSSALKVLAIDALGIGADDILRFGDISTKLHPVEFGYAPFAKAAMTIKLKNKGKEKKRKGWKYKRTWPDMLKEFVIHWGYNAAAREYAKRDIVYTRALHKHKDFVDAKMNDDDSVLACQVAVGRWRGYPINIAGVQKLLQKAIDSKYMVITDKETGKQEKVLIPSTPSVVKNWLCEVCDPTEQLAITCGDTAKITLENLAKDWNLPCPDCSETQFQHMCKTCKGKGLVPHPVAIRAQMILDGRHGQKEVELYEKLLAAGRFHVSTKIIGALSGRMSGASGLNPQAIKKTKIVKEVFLFAQNGMVLCGGDFAGFEVTIAVAVYNDEGLQKDLLTCEKCKSQMIFNQNILDYECTNEKCKSHTGMKIHALFGVHVFPSMTYEQIKATDGTADDKYTRCKSGVFALIYMGEGFTLMTKLGVPIEVADEAVAKFRRRYPGVGKSQQYYKDKYGAILQKGGRGTKVDYVDPLETVETLFGFKRYFTLENRISKAMFELASKMPKRIADAGKLIKVVRYEREQFAGGAAMSAIYGAIFALRSFCVRAAGNHVIQGTGAAATKMVQRRIWDLQPAGIHEWLVQPANFHDSVMTPVAPHMVDAVAKMVQDTVESTRPKIPLIKLDWLTYLANWASKGKETFYSYRLDDPEKKPIKEYKGFSKIKTKHRAGIYACLVGHTSSYCKTGWKYGSSL